MADGYLAFVQLYAAAIVWEGLVVEFIELLKVDALEDGCGRADVPLGGFYELLP